MFTNARTDQRGVIENMAEVFANGRKPNPIERLLGIKQSSMDVCMFQLAVQQ